MPAVHSRLSPSARRERYTAGAIGRKWEESGYKACVPSLWENFNKNNERIPPTNETVFAASRSTPAPEQRSSSPSSRRCTPSRPPPSSPGPRSSPPSLFQNLAQYRRLLLTPRRRSERESLSDGIEGEPMTAPPGWHRRLLESSPDSSIREPRDRDGGGLAGGKSEER